MPSPQVTVKNGGAAPVDPVASGVGINVTAGATIIIQLQNLAADTWTCTLVDQDDLVAAPALTFDAVNKNVTFTAPAAPFSLIFESVVNGGQDINTNPVATYRQRFGIYCLATGSLRLLASNERAEGSALFGWITAFNACIRLCATALASISGNDVWQTGPDANYTITGTGNTQVVELPAAFTAPRTYTLPVAPADGMKAGVYDRRRIISNSGNTLTLSGGTSHIYVAGVDKGTTWIVDDAFFKGGTAMFRFRSLDSTWHLA